MRTFVTMSILAGSSFQAAAAPMRSRSHSPDAHNLALQAPLIEVSPPSRLHEDAMRAFELARRFNEHLNLWEGDVDADAIVLTRRQMAQEDADGHVFVSATPAPEPEPTPAAVQKEPTPPPAPPVVERAQAPLAPQPPARKSDAALFEGIDAKQNAIAVVWDGPYEASFNVYANSGPYQPGLGAAYTSRSLEPGEITVIELPEGFSGRVQLMSGQGRADDAATWAEVAFDQWQGLTFFDASLIRGTNAGLSMRASDGSDSAEVSKKVLEDAPADARVIDSGGHAVIEDTEGYDGSLHQAAIDWLHDNVGPKDAYVRNFEDTATHSTKDHHMVFEFSV
jgi:hypothetical protein